MKFSCSPLKRMVALTLTLVALPVAPAVAAPIPLGTVVLRDGREMKDVQVMKVEADGLRVQHQTGVGKWLYEDLPSAISARFHLEASPDPKPAEAEGKSSSPGQKSQTQPTPEKADQTGTEYPELYLPSEIPLSQPETTLPVLQTSLSVTTPGIGWYSGITAYSPWYSRPVYPIYYPAWKRPIHYPVNWCPPVATPLPYGRHPHRPYSSPYKSYLNRGVGAQYPSSRPVTGWATAPAARPASYPFPAQPNVRPATGVIPRAVTPWVPPAGSAPRVMATPRMIPSPRPASIGNSTPRPHIFRK